MTNIDDLVEQLKEAVQYQQLPEPIEDEEYQQIVIHAIKRLYIDTGRAEVFSIDKIHEEDEQLVFDDDLIIDEEEYVMLICQILFFKKVQASVNNIVGYTTNALTVTGADKPYTHIQDTIANLENERRIVYYKMCRYTM